MSDELNDLRITLRVARRGSFSAVAREFGLTQPAVSRAVARLESSIGVPLLTRTTRAVSLTEAGAAYLAKAEPALLALTEAGQAARGSDEVSGVVRLALSSSIAVKELIPALPAFREAHPNVRLVLVIADERRRLVEEGMDLSLRIGPLEASTMVAKLVGRWPYGLYAAPAYLAGRGLPDHPDDLRRLDAVYHAENPAQHWTFRKGPSVVHLEIPPCHVVSSQEGCIAAAKAGLGYIHSAPIAIREELAAGTLTSLLEEWDIGCMEMSLLFPAGRAATKAARALAKFIAAHFSARSGVAARHLP